MSTPEISQSNGGFLFTTFQPEVSPLSEQIYFGLSRNGREWEALHDAEPLLVSTLGERGVRDSFIIRSRDGQRFFLIATDLSVYTNRDWERNVRAGSRSLVIWESDDLVHWSEPRLVAVAAEDAGCAWAPEAIYDQTTNDYLVFWASTNARDNFSKQRIWASRTADFKAFSEPFIYIEKPHHVIDTNIVFDGEKYFRFSKDDEFKAITMEASENLMGPWQDMPDFSLAQLEGYEGPECFLLEPATPTKAATWCLLLDYYSKGAGYHPFLCNDLSSGQFAPALDFTFSFPFRHGSVLPITTAEYERLQTAYSNEQSPSK
jgi:arabinoxylan arabinofuranohydrolase